MRLARFMSTIIIGLFLVAHPILAQQTIPDSLFEGLVWRLGGPGDQVPGTTTQNVQSVSDRFGRANAAFRIAAKGGVIRIQDHPALNPREAITVAAWVKPSSFAGTGINTVIEKNSSPSQPAYQYKLYMTGDRYRHYQATCGFRLNIGGKMYQTLSPQGTWKPEQWHHMVGTYDGKALRFYLDGSLLNTEPCTGLLETSNLPLQLGQYTDRPNLDSLPADISDAAIWNRALSSAEIQFLYSDTNLPKPKAPGTNTASPSPSSGSVNVASLALPPKVQKLSFKVQASSTFEHPFLGWGLYRVNDGILISDMSASPASNGWSSQDDLHKDHQEFLFLEFDRTYPHTPFPVIHEVRLYPRTDLPGQGFPGTISIQVESTPGQWTEIARKSFPGAPTTIQSIVLPGIAAESIRVVGTSLHPIAQDGGQYRFQLAEIEIYGIPGQ